MSRTFYTDYVRHALRFYSRNYDIQRFKTDVDKSNWLACKSVLDTLSEKDREMLMQVYSGFDTLPDEVFNTSREYHIDQNVIWDLMKKVENKIAHRRKLI